MFGQPGRFFGIYLLMTFPCRCALLGVCESYGMPSSHTQAVAYCLAAFFVLRLCNPKGPHLQKMLTVAEGTGLACLTVTVAYARVYLGYHTAFQVWMGGLAGLLFGAIWTWSCLGFLRRHGSSVLERFPVLLSLGFSTERVSISEGQKQS